jgi:Spy/CpxP family protein refolding chaperone
MVAPDTTPQVTRRWRWARRTLLGGGVALALAAPTAWIAQSQIRRGGADLESAQEWAAVFVRQSLRKLDATPDQHAKVQAIVERALGDLYPLRDQHRASRDAALKLLAADTVDRAGAEALRARQIALYDQASKRMMQAVLDVAEVLTPAQRDALAKEIAERRWRHH